MPRPDKIEAVAEITADLKAADVYYFVDYRGSRSPSPPNCASACARSTPISRW